MKKNKKLHTLTFTSLMVTLPSVMLAISCSHSNRDNNDINNNINIVVKNNNVTISAVNSIVASSLWNDKEEVKNLIIQNKNIIFDIKNENFDLINNLKILNIENSQLASDEGKLIVKIKIENAGGNNEILETELIIGGFKKSNIINDGAIEGYDYFVLPGKDSSEYKNRITDVFTKNSEVIKRYGNAPLPWVDDSMLTTNDIVNMFSYMCLYAGSSKVTFGLRKINANTFIAAFFEWMTKYRKYFPYKSFDNTPPYFYGVSENGEKSSEINAHKINTDKYINQTTWYIEKVDWPNFDDIYQPGKNREEFLRFVTKLFRYVQPGMSDVEKLFLCENFVMNWLYYDGKKTTPPFDNKGVCADYANLLGFALSILDVPSVTIDCGSQAEPHAITWTYLDLYGKGEKKWYASDMTWGDYNDREIGNIEGITGLALPNPSKAWYLFDVGVNQFTPIDSIHPSAGKSPWQHDISNKIYGLPWSDIGQGKSPIGVASYGNEDNYAKYFDYLFNGKFDGEYQDKACMKSRAFYLNGYTYYFSRNPSSPYGVSLYKVKCVIGASPEEVSIELDKKYMDKFMFDKSNGRNYETTYPPLVQQYGNKIAILLNPKKSSDSNYQRSILLINTNENGIDWKNVKEFPIPNSNELNQDYIFNFDIEWDGTLRLDYSSQYFGAELDFKTKMIDMGLEFKNNILFNANTNNRKGDFDIAKQYFNVLISSYRIGDKNGYLPFNVRKDFINFIKQQSNNKNYFEAIQNIYKKYIEISSTIFKHSNDIIQNKMLNNIYSTSMDNFKQYGYGFSGFETFANPDDMLSISNANVKYDIYFSNKKPTKPEDLKSFTKIAENSNSTHIDMTLIEKYGFISPAGYYYFEIKSKNSKTRTNVCELKILDEELYFESKLNTYSYSLPTTSNTRITNYTNQVLDWYNDKIIFDFQIFYNELFKNKYDLNIQLKHINVDSKKIKVIKDNSFFSPLISNNQIKGKVELNEIPNNNNHGIYYLDILATNKETKQKVNFYSQFTFIFTLNDYENWDINIWKDAIETLKLFN